jgi:hypothetical protein
MHESMHRNSPTSPVFKVDKTVIGKAVLPQKYHACTDTKLQLRIKARLAEKVI